MIDRSDLAILLGRLLEVPDRLDRLESMVEMLVDAGQGETLTTTEAARILHRDVKTIRQLIRSDKLAASRGEGPHAQYRIERAALEAYKRKTAVGGERCQPGQNIRPMFQQSRGRKPRGRAK